MCHFWTFLLCNGTEPEQIYRAINVLEGHSKLWLLLVGRMGLAQLLLMLSLCLWACVTHTHTLKFLLMFPRVGPPDIAPGRALSAVLDSPLTAVDATPSHRLLSRRDAGSGDHRGLSLWHRVLRA